jgi:hypothetical protein
VTGEAAGALGSGLAALVTLACCRVRMRIVASQGIGQLRRELLGAQHDKIRGCAGSLNARKRGLTQARRRGRRCFMRMGFDPPLNK